MAIQTTKFGTLDTSRAPVYARESDGTYALDFDIGGKKYTFVPSDIVNKGGWTSGNTNYLLPYFTDKANIARFVYNSDQVDLASEPGIAKYLESQGRSSTGYLLPADKVSFDGKVDTTPSTQMGALVGLRQDDQGNVVYGVSGGHGKSYMTKDFQVHDPYTEVRHKFFGGKLGSLLVQANELINDIGPIGPALLNLWAPGLGTAMSIGTAIGSGADLEKVLKNVGLAYAGQELGSAANMSVDEALRDIGTAGDVIGNVVGQTTAGLVASGGKTDPLSLLQAGALGEAVSAVATEIPNYNALSDASKRSVNNAIAATLQGRDPTAALISLAKNVGETAAATSVGAITEDQAAKQQEEFQKELAKYEAPAPQPAPVTAAPSTTEPAATPDYPVQEMQITPENLASFQDTLSSNFQGSQWQPSENGDYTLTGDDGSTITMHADGTTSATEAPAGNLLDTIGATETQPTQTTPTGGQPTQTTATGGTQPTQTKAAPTPEAAPKGLSVDQLASLYSLFEGETPAAAPQTAEQGAAGAQAYAPAKEASFLGELGEKPHYLEGLDPETAALLKQIGIDPAELMAQQEAEGGAEDASEPGEEGADFLEAPGGTGGFRTREGIKRGLPAGTLGIAGSDVAKAYQAARADQGFDTSRAFKLPIDDYSRAYMQQLAKAGEAALGEQWAPYIAGRQLAASGQPSADMTQSGNTLAYVPSASIGQYKGFTGALAPQLVAMVGKDPELLNDPEYLAAVLGHELSHQPQQDAGQFMRDLGIHPGRVGSESAAMSGAIASAIPYLAEKYGYKGFYDTKANAPLNERLADIGGWQMQNQVNLTQDPIFKQQVLNTPERMAVYNAMMPQRGVQLDPSFPPVGQLTLEDFGGMNPPIPWAYRNLDRDQFKAVLKKRMLGMFEGGAIPSGGISGT